MVVTAHPLATKAGLSILKKGGNSIDATITASLVLSVVRPHSTGIGGGGFLLFYDSTKQISKAYDFRERAPLLATKHMFIDTNGEPKDFTYQNKRIPKASLNGPLSVGVPGLIAGLLHLHNKYGSLDLKTLLEPAIKIAAEGFIIYDKLAAAIDRRKTIMANFLPTKKIFFKNNQPLKVGDRLIQTDLAQTLTRISINGEKEFYQGQTAKKIVHELSKGGILSLQDLKNYQVKERAPIVGTYNGHHIVSMSPPSSGGLHIIQILNILENFPLKTLQHHTSDSIHIISEAMKLAFYDRAKYLGDPDFVSIPIAKLISKEYAYSLSKKINPNSTIQLDNRTLFSQDESPSTTHLSIVDRFGNAVSSTQTINFSFGSCVVAEGTGIVLNDEMDDFSIHPGKPNAYGLIGSNANAIAAKKTMLSSMSPSFIFDPNNQLIMILGSPGGSRIITATLQVILNQLEFNMSLEKSIHSPRFHHQWIPNRLFLEQNRFSRSVIQELQKKGHYVTPSKYTMGDIQAIGKMGEELWQGVSDWRDIGLPLGR